MSINMGPIMLAIMSQTLCQYIFILFNKTFSSCYCYSLVHHLAVQFCAYDVLMDVVVSKKAISFWVITYSIIFLAQA